MGRKSKKVEDHSSIGWVVTVHDLYRMALYLSFVSSYPDERLLEHFFLLFLVDFINFYTRIMYKGAIYTEHPNYIKLNKFSGECIKLKRVHMHQNNLHQNEWTKLSIQNIFKKKNTNYFILL